MTFADILHRRALDTPHDEAFSYGPDSLTYGQLDERARAVAGLLPRGRTVLLLLEPGLDFVAGFFGCLYAGAIAVPAYPPARDRDVPRLRAVAADAQAAVALAHAASLGNGGRGRHDAAGRPHRLAAPRRAHRRRPAAARQGIARADAAGDVSEVLRKEASRVLVAQLPPTEAQRRLDAYADRIAPGSPEERLMLACRAHWSSLIGDSAARTADFARRALAGDRVARLEAALAVIEGSPVRLERLRIVCDLGTALRLARRQVDAREPLRAALDEARRLGAVAIARRAHDELSATGETVRPFLVTGAEALTPSERRVAALAAGGRSNRAIAQALFLTVKTVETHLSAAYPQLDIAGRAEPSWARRSWPDVRPKWFHRPCDDPKERP